MSKLIKAVVWNAMFVATSCVFYGIFTILFIYLGGAV